jgi:hypothetical protein
VRRWRGRDRTEGTSADSASVIVVVIAAARRRRKKRTTMTSDDDGRSRRKVVLIFRVVSFMHGWCGGVGRCGQLRMIERIPIAHHGRWWVAYRGKQRRGLVVH